MRIIEVKCSNCGIVTQKPIDKVRRNKRNFCNRKCMGEWRTKNDYRINRQIIICKYCGKKFVRVPSLILEGNQFCDRECFKKYYNWQEKQIIHCDNCGCIIIKQYNRIVRSKNHFCSPTCGSQYKSKNKKGRTLFLVFCSYCGQDIMRTAEKLRRNKKFFCSKDCQKKWMSENLQGPQNPRFKSKLYQCKWCGIQIMRYPSQYENRKHIFCSIKCSSAYKTTIIGEDNPLWRGGRKKYPKEWQNDLKAGIRKRDNYICQLCMKTQQQNGKLLDIHHIDYNPKNLNQSNLISLCTNCHHSKVHGQRKNRKYWRSYCQDKIQGIYNLDLVI